MRGCYPCAGDPEHDADSRAGVVSVWLRLAASSASPVAAVEKAFRSRMTVAHSWQPREARGGSHHGRLHPGNGFGRNCCKPTSHHYPGSPDADEWGVRAGDYARPQGSDAHPTRPPQRESGLQTPLPRSGHREPKGIRRTRTRPRLDPGARMAVTRVHEMRRRRTEHAAATLCGGRGESTPLSFSAPAALARRPPQASRLFVSGSCRSSGWPRRAWAWSVVRGAFGSAAGVS
jgi:hypothetical protein